MPCTDGGVPYDVVPKTDYGMVGKYSHYLPDRYAYLKRVAESLRSILGFVVPKPKWYGGSQEDIDVLAAKMCEFIQTNLVICEAAIYDGRNKDARVVADWWDEHKEVDEQRKAYEAETAAKKKTKEDRKKARAEIAEWFKVNSVSYPLRKEQWILINN